MVSLKIASRRTIGCAVSFGTFEHFLKTSVKGLKGRNSRKRKATERVSRLCHIATVITVNVTSVLDLDLHLASDEAC